MGSRALLCALLLASCDRVFGLADVTATARDDARADMAYFDAPEPCPEGYTPIVNTPLTSTYRYSAQGTTWLLAEQDCENDAFTHIAHLVVFDNQLEMVSIRDYLNIGGGFTAWAGYARDLGADPLQFYAVTGEPVPDTRPPWNDTEPNNGYGANEEPVVWFSSTNDLTDAPNDISLGFVCECDHRQVTKQFRVQ